MERRRSRKIPEGQMSLFHKMDQPVLNSPEEVRSYLSALMGRDVSAEVLTRVARSRIFQEVLNDNNPQSLRERLRELVLENDS